MICLVFELFVIDLLDRIGDSIFFTFLDFFDLDDFCFISVSIVS
jgi:hypothetical protein